MKNEHRGHRVEESFSQKPPLSKSLFWAGALSAVLLLNSCVTEKNGEQVIYPTSACPISLDEVSHLHKKARYTSVEKVPGGVVYTFLPRTHYGRVSFFVSDQQQIEEIDKALGVGSVTRD